MNDITDLLAFLMIVRLESMGKISQWDFSKDKAATNQFVRA
jgi:hypothetical protein